MESIAAEKSSMPPITATGGFSNSSLEFEDANEEQRLFYDSFSKRYFQATISQVLQAEYHINRNMVLGAFVTLNDFYDFLGISHVEGGDVVGWLMFDSMYWIDFDKSNFYERFKFKFLQHWISHSILHSISHVAISLF